MNHRRRFLAAAGAGTIATAFPAVAQPSPFRVGWLAPGTMAESSPLLDALRQGLRDLGYSEDRNLVIDARWGDHAGARTETLAAELVAGKPHVIVTLGPVAYAVHRATTSIPVVFGFSGDPVQAGFARSFSRPGGNFTGISFLALELVGKRIELLKAVMPGVQRIAIVANSQHPGDQAERRASAAAATAMGLEIEYFEAAGILQLDHALGAIQKSRHEAVVMFPIQSIISNSARIAAWSLKNRIPAVSGWAQFAEEGNLMSYGANMGQTFRRLATFVDRILKGAKPADLPVELPLQVELVINLKTAKALGVAVPQALLLRADRVIE
jgi:putative ABC transport system substrate-binding protein